MNQTDNQITPFTAAVNAHKTKSFLSKVFNKNLSNLAKKYPVAGLGL